MFVGLLTKCKAVFFFLTRTCYVSPTIIITSYHIVTDRTILRPRKIYKNYLTLKKILSNVAYCQRYANFRSNSSESMQRSKPFLLKQNLTKLPSGIKFHLLPWMLGPFNCSPALRVFREIISLCILHHIEETKVTNKFRPRQISDLRLSKFILISLLYHKFSAFLTEAVDFISNMIYFF